MLREQKAPSGPRPADFTSAPRENYDPSAGSSRSRMPSGAEPMLNASSRNNHSLFSFGGNTNKEETQNTTSPYDFVPTVSFDDLQNSLTESNELNLSQFPVPNGQGSVFGNRPAKEEVTSAVGGEKALQNARGPLPQRPSRTGSLIRRQSNSTRQSSMSSTTSGASGTMDPPNAPLAMRTRRTSQYPPISGSTTGKGARKSIGHGVAADPDFSTRASQRRRPSLASSASANSLSEAGGFRSSIGGSGNIAADGARLATARAAKAKSLQPPPRHGPPLSTANMTPDHIRSSSFVGRSPGRPNGRGTSTPSSSAKRASVMPGMPTSTSHATGLGARTISPTDARRAKRLSTLQGPPPMPNTPPHYQQEQMPTGRPSSRSPSMLPRKTSTPSSSRTTPDINRKSYSSGLSIGSNGSYNTARTSTGSLQPRIPQSASTSRLPTPKPRNVHSSAGNDEEDVPPVPAIPKAYESPKDSPAEPPFFNKRKSSLPFDASSINSISTNELSGPGSIRDSVKTESSVRSKRGVPAASGSDVDQRTAAQPAKKKNLQPLRLPPLNLLPLSMPTTAKIAALQDAPPSDGTVTPPPRKVTNKTPSTPMTASKSSFFSSRNRQDEKAEDNQEQKRSISSIHHIRTGSSTTQEASNPGFGMPITYGRSTRQNVSPFVSTSLPKTSGEYSFLPRSQTTGDTSVISSHENDHKPPRLTGPRAQKGGSQVKNTTPTPAFDVSSPDEPTTPSSTSSLRRKLSLGWKRAASKTSMNNISHAANERDQEYPPQPPKHGNMPPPRLPASATMNNMSSMVGPSPSPSIKSTTYLDSKRRKSSASSLNMTSGHDRTRSDSWGLNRSPKKDASFDASFDGAERPKLSASRTSSSVLSPVHRILGSKASTSTLKSSDPWTVDLDKDDMSAEEEMRKLGSKRKETEQAARQLDALRKRATPKERVSPQHAIQIANLNIFERGEIVDYKDVFFCGTQTATKHVGDLKSDAANFGYDDDRGDYTIVLGDHLSFRYEIIDILGKGSFGQVVRCIDHKTGGLVAIKIIRNKKRFHLQALVEVNILQKLREWDPQNKHSMVNFTQSFYFRSHLCISTELLDMNLYEFIKSNGFRGFSLKLIRRFTKQLLSSLLLLKQHKVIHCDLKPENILLAHPMHSEIKVIDFGSSCFENEKVYTYIQSRFYRSPEVILGMTYGMPIDMWSVGCILAELFTGYPIFPGENEQEQLACIMEVFGPPEKHLIEKSTRKKLFFDSLGKPRLTVSSKGRRRKPSSKSLQQVLKCEDEAFLDFLTRCLRWDPDRRMKPDEAIRHEFLTGQKSAMPTASRPPVSSRNESPIKRHNTVSTPSGGMRPLPEPPGTAFRNGTGIRTREPAGPSPIKSSAPRRQSTVSGLSTTTGSKRTSTGAVIAGSNSGLPRVTTRSVSARQDIASAGASAAMTRRA